MSDCAGKHRAGDGSYLLYDLNQIPTKRACDKCRRLIDPDRKLQKAYDREADLARYHHMMIFQPNI